MSKHRDFILMPIDNILKEAVFATNAVGFTIKAYPLYDYIMQSIFIKMTGFQEQKLKCIVWELATDDYDYRYRKLSNKLGECSSYDDKNNIYNEMIDIITKYNLDFKIEGFFSDKRTILNSARERINIIFKDSYLASCQLKSFVQSLYILDLDILDLDNLPSELLLEKHLFKDKSILKNIYTKYLYKARNRIAHNTLSYQQNLPTLKVLKDENYKYENYFLWFAILVLIDEVFLRLYKEYLGVSRG